MNRSSGIKVNILADCFGKGWSVIISLAFVPLYLKFLGIEAFALVGVFFSLRGLFALFGVGLSATINREMASMSDERNQIQRVHDLLRTLEFIHWIIGILIALIVIGMSSPIAHYWLNEQKLPPDTVRIAIVLIGITMAMQWPFSFYSGGLMGLQRHVKLNAITSIIATIRGIGGVTALWLISPTIQVFFAWQIIAAAFQSVVIAKALHSSLPSSTTPPKFRKQYLIQTWRFTTGVSAVSMLGTILRQLDKIILSKLLPLDIFGYYAIANMLCEYLVQLAMPIYNAVFPKFSKLIAQASLSSLKKLYHTGCQLISVLIFPIVGTIAVFSEEILMLWKLDTTTITNTQKLVSILVIGKTFSVLLRLPYGLQLAYGWVKLAFYLNLIGVVLLGPITYWLVTQYGAVGGAFSILILHAVSFFVAMPLMHRKLLNGELKKWYIHDVGYPLIPVFIIVWVGRYFLPLNLTYPMLFFAITSICLLSMIVSAMTTPDLRAAIKQQYFDRLHKISYIEEIDA
jgi:O-antigen/teichoic acid export membrane protein